jgi:hypothetical protein
MSILSFFLLVVSPSRYSAPPPITRSPSDQDTFLYSPTDATRCCSDERHVIFLLPLPACTRFYKRNQTRYTVELEGRASVTAQGWPTDDRVWVEEGNQITRRMTQFPSGESLGGGELELGPLGLGFLVAGVGDGGCS